jgi:alcohol dehydrogenase class IV
MALINYLTRIHFADRVLEDALAEQIRLLGIKRPLIVTDCAGATDEPLARLTDALPQGCRASVLFLRPGLSADKAATDIHAAFLEDQCDGYLGLGSEVALTLARRAAHDVRGFSGRMPAKRVAPGETGRPRMIAIPTSSACVGVQPILVDPARGARRGNPSDSAMLPDVVLCDPTLTLGLKPDATAAAGMDALSHCIEAFLGTTWNPPADGMALDGVRRASANLDRAVSHGSDLDARRELMAAALDAGLAAQKGLGAVEALSHALEEEAGVGTIHGHLHAALLPVVLAFNAPAINGRMSALGAALRELPHVSQEGDVASRLSALGARIRLPLNLGALQLGAAGRARVARRACEHPATRTNPRHATTADYVSMLEHAC